MKEVENVLNTDGLITSIKDDIEELERVYKTKLILQRRELKERVIEAVEKKIKSGYNIGHITAEYSYDNRVDFQKIMNGRELKDLIIKSIETIFTEE